MSLMDELFRGGSGDEMDFIKKMAILSALSSMQNEKMQITAMGLEIKVGPLGITVQSIGNEKLLEDLELVDALKQFTEEVKPIAEKYGNLVTERAKRFLGGGGTEEPSPAKPDSPSDRLEELIKILFQ